MTGVPNPGERLGRYLVESTIGRGGMGVVCKIRDPRSDMPYAAKVLHPELARRREFARRFKREASTLFKLSHKHIVHTYGLEMDGDLVFAAATGRSGRSPNLPELTDIGRVAAECLARAIARAIFEAIALPFPGAVPAWRDRFGV